MLLRYTIVVLLVSLLLIQADSDTDCDMECEQENDEVFTIGPVDSEEDTPDDDTNDDCWINPIVQGKCVKYFLCNSTDPYDGTNYMNKRLKAIVSTSRESICKKKDTLNTCCPKQNILKENEVKPPNQTMVIKLGH